MSRLLLVPLEDVVVFPGMSLTLAIDAGEEERVLLVPRHEQRVRGRRHRRRGHRPRPPARWRPRLSRCRACTAASPAPPRRCPTAGCSSRSRSSPTPSRSTARPATWSASTAPWSRRSSSSAATTAASSAFLRSHHRARARWPTPAATPPTSSYEQKVKLLQTLDVTERLELALRLPARAAGRAAGPQAHPRRRRVRRREAAARVLPAQADGVDPQGARRGRRLDRRGVPHQDRRGRHARARRASRPRRSSAASSGWASSPPSRA